MLWRRNRLPTPVFLSSCVAQLVKNLPAMWETWVQSLSWEDPLEKGKATHSSILAWRIPWTTVHGDARSQTWLSYLHFHFLYSTHPASNTPYTSTGLRFFPLDSNLHPWTWLLSTALPSGHRHQCSGTLKMQSHQRIRVERQTLSSAIVLPSGRKSQSSLLWSQYLLDF